MVEGQLDGIGVEDGNLTMSTNVNGVCQMAERSLGRGDVLGLGRKYD